MAGSIYLLRSETDLVELKEAEYDSERLLQELLASHPSLLAGEQMDGAVPRRWLLVDREVQVPTDDSAYRGYLDHLFLDQDATPTLIEVKRSRNSEVRREIVGQMLDYAANGVLHWRVDTIRGLFESRCARQGLDPAQEVAHLLQGDGETENFWERVRTNLTAGKIRLVFVADTIPAPLRRVVEFLNGQMEQAEVFAVEVKQYVGQNLRTLVPSVIGVTAESEQRKGSGGRGEQWDETSFFEELERRRGKEDTAIARRILDRLRPQLSGLGWGRGTKDGSVYLYVRDGGGQQHYPLFIWTYGSVEVQFQWEMKKPPFDDVEKRREWLTWLNRIPGVSIAQDSLGRRPSFPMSVLRDETALDRFYEMFDWMAQEIRSA